MKLPSLCPGVLLSTAYLPPVEYIAWAARSERVLIEQYDTYAKQTYRNRCLIAAAGGMQALTVPVEKTAGTHTLTRDLRLSDHGNWRHLHWQALQSAYRSSPFFDYYADEFAPFYEQKHTFLLDFNEALLRLILKCMDVEARIGRTTDFHPVAKDAAHSEKALPLATESAGTFPENRCPLSTADSPACPESRALLDLREAIHPKHPRPTGFRARPYYQVFADRFGFLPNLSSVDLLFNMGPESILVLRDSLFPPDTAAPPAQ
ncbi:MAG: WbqC family protein [Bacteroidaceae bacterium]|jgi:hypothetical protein